MKGLSRDLQYLQRYLEIFIPYFVAGVALLVLRTNNVSLVYLHSSHDKTCLDGFYQEKNASGCMILAHHLGESAYCTVQGYVSLSSLCAAPCSY